MPNCGPCSLSPPKFQPSSSFPAEEEASEAGGGGERAVLKAQPLRVYQGHKADVLDVAWSKSQFLLSASMDKSVRLWHISMDDCLRVFRCAPPA